MGRFRDLSGRVFGKLQVIRQVGRRGRYAVIWECRCGCGNIVRVVSADLNRGKYRSCGKCVKRTDISEGQRFGRWTVINMSHWAKNGNAVCLCVCDCGTEREVLVAGLLSGRSRSCGCLQREKVGLRSTTHGDHKTTLYNKWAAMRQRCNNSNVPGYKNYGGRGISVCDDWQKFGVFKKWALQNGYDDSLTIERIDVNGNYEPANVTFITAFDQHSNRRDNKYLVHNGQKKTLEEWSRVSGIPASTIRKRYTAGLGPSLILFKGALRYVVQR